MGKYCQSIHFILVIMSALRDYLASHDVSFSIGNLSSNSTNFIPIIMDPLVLDKILFRIELWQVSHGYILFPLCLFGIIGNILSFTILTRKAVRSTTIALYLRCLAVADIFVLLTAIFRYRSYKLFFDDEGEKWSIYHFDPYIQVYVEPIHWMALGVSSFTTLALSMERYLAVRFPIRIKQACTLRVVRAVIIGIITMIFIISIPNYFAYTVGKFLRDNKSYVAVAMLTTMGKKTLYHCVYHSYLIPILWYILPWLMLAVFSMLLSKNVRKSSQIRVDVPTMYNPNRNLNLLIIMIVVLFLICNFPNCIIVFYNLVHHTKDNDICTHETQGLLSKTTKLYDTLEVIGEILNVFNSCINFIIYCVVGTKFRKELKRFILCEKCKQKRTNRVVPSLSNNHQLRDTTTEISNGR